MLYDLIVIGGGAAGFFAAINSPKGTKTIILEKNRAPLQKVKVSGGGRCNVTHHCFEPEKLIENYPRGKEFLLEPFRRFGPSDTINWFSERGVSIKKEQDGRMFPVTDSSQTIIDCFQKELSKKNIELRASTKVLSFSKEEDCWQVSLENEEKLETKNLLIATGGDKAIWNQLRSLNLSIVEPVPSLFTFQIQDKFLHELSGTSFESSTVKTKGFRSSGPMLITHWGLSGPAVLKLSAFAARELANQNYSFTITVDWLAEISTEKIVEELRRYQTENPKKKVRSLSVFGLSKRFWEYICNESSVGEFQNWSETGKKHFRKISENLKKKVFHVEGKTTFKEEFVTAGGVCLSEIDPNSFMVNKYPGLYLAGEVMDIDAVTGGFNFQAAWTSAYIVSNSIAAKNA